MLQVKLPSLDGRRGSEVRQLLNTAGKWDVTKALQKMITWYQIPTRLRILSKLK